MKFATRRYLSFLMAFAMFFSILPTNVLAVKEIEFVSLATSTPPVYDIDDDTIVGTLTDIDPSTNSLSVPSKIWTYTTSKH